MNKEIPAEMRQSTVRDEIYKALTETNIREKPVEYLDLLDEYEAIVMHEAQEERRNVVLGKLRGQNVFQRILL